MTDFATNPKARFDYEIVETLEAGIILKGYEVKAVKTGKVSLRGSYVKIINGKPMLLGATISPYQEHNLPETYDPQASHELLLSKREISALTEIAHAQGLILVPMKFYAKKGLVKLEIGVARGKKKYDKRESIKKKDVARAKQRGIEG